jgi:hypothetical protein
MLPTSAGVFARCLTCGLVFLLMAAGMAAGSEAYLVPTEFRNQEGTNAPTLDPHRPYRVLSELRFAENSPLDGYLERVSFPSRHWRYARIEGGGMWLGVDFHDLGSLTSAFPTGGYQWRVGMMDGQSLTGPVELAPVSFPAAPQIDPGDHAVWIGSRLVLTAPASGAVMTWQPPGAGVYEVFVSVNGVDTTLPAGATSFEFTPGLVETLPVESPVSCLVQFNSPGGHTATTVWLWVPRLQERAYFSVARNRVFVQTDNGQPAPWTPADAALFDSDYGPCHFSIFAAAPGEVVGPGNRTFPLVFSSPDAAVYSSGPYDTQDALKADYPDGDYALGERVTTLDNPRFPNGGVPVKLASVNGRPPRWRDGKLLLDAKRDNTLVWSAFRPVRGLPFAARGLITLQFGFISNASWQITDELGAGFAAGRKSVFNRYRIVKASLSTDRDYLLSIRYFLASDLRRETWSAAGAASVTYLVIAPES